MNNLSADRRRILRGIFYIGIAPEIWQAHS
jgi:hypothetical protein